MWGFPCFFSFLGSVVCMWCVCVCVSSAVLEITLPTSMYFTELIDYTHIYIYISFNDTYTHIYCLCFHFNKGHVVN